MGSKSYSVGFLASENLGAGFVSQLPSRRLHYGNEKRVSHFEGSGEMLRHMRGDDTGCQSGSEHLMPLPEMTIPKTLDEVAAGQAERSCAVEGEPSDRVSVFTTSSLNRDPLLFASAKVR